jgi:hypothetical protein
MATIFPISASAFNPTNVELKCVLSPAKPPDMNTRLLTAVFKPFTNSLPFTKLPSENQNAGQLILRQLID